MPWPLALVLAGLLASGPPPPQLIQLGSTAFGKPVEIAVDARADAQANAVTRQAIQEALTEVSALDRLTDPDGDAGAAGSLAAFNAAAGKGPQPIDARLIPAFSRALDFCYWSEKAFGPLARDLNRLWGLRKPVAVSPVKTPADLDRAVAAADCGRLRVDAKHGTAELAAGSGADLWGFAEGLAVDRAIEVLRKHGVRDGFVRVGGIERGFGPGPAGHGWRVELPLFPGMSSPLSPIFLRDKALAVVSSVDKRLKIGDATFAPWLSHRTGQPAQGSVAVLAVTELALDAQGLAVTLSVTSPAEGQLRLGSLRPRPGVLWLQGTGAGEPLQIDYNWGEVPKR
jgi:FAD:protein FMN transferase